MQVLDNGGVEFTNEGSGARLRVFAALKHRFMKQVWPFVSGNLFTRAPLAALQMSLLGRCGCDLVPAACYCCLYKVTALAVQH